ncbi:MAG TPA: Wzy polymerase domain-containing protein [Burkholderiales bacterium]|nr:Wzy polymerase domain-containing protein [Burkholderiales bacterium]
MKRTAAGPHSIGLLLSGAMCSLPFLIPYHQLPVLSFYPEWLAAGLGVCAALAALVPRGAATASFPSPALWLAGFALFLLVRTADPAQPYPQISLLAALYVVFAVLMIWLGAQLAGVLGHERVALVLAASLLAGALANALAGVIQLCGRPAVLEDIVAQLSGGRAYGNIAQANLYANYLALGQCALLYLWYRLRVRTAYAVPAALLLAVASALSASRSAILFAAWIALLGALAGRFDAGPNGRRLKWAGYLVAAGMLAAYFSASSLGSLRPEVEPGSDPRWQIYALGWRVFAAAPIFGVGAGGFAGAAFAHGLEPSLTRIGEVLTSPHDLPLHLLAEAGIVGAVLVLGALAVWGRQLARHCLANPPPALWWVVAASGVELIHSLVEFPFWSADFLGVAALLLGVGVASGAPTRSRLAPERIAAASCCAALVFALVALLRDYVRLDATRITGSAVTLASPADARRDSATLESVSRGLLAPVAELWIVLGAPLDRSDLSAKLAISGRVAAAWPSQAAVVRRSVFLALNGDAEDARALLERALRTFAHLRPAIIAILEEASVADADALRPLLLRARGTATESSNAFERRK